MGAGLERAGPRMTEVSESEKLRKLLVVVDETPECKAAIYFASRRAAATGARVTMLYVLSPPDFQHWQSVKKVMEEEAREEAERTLQDLAAEVKSVSGQMPELIIREGQTKEQIRDLIAEDRAIKSLVLAAAEGNDPGPLVSSIAKGGFLGQNSGGVAIPVTIVPGQLSRDELDALS